MDKLARPPPPPLSHSRKLQLAVVQPLHVAIILYILCGVEQHMVSGYVSLFFIIASVKPEVSKEPVALIRSFIICLSPPGHAKRSACRLPTLPSNWRALS